MVDERTLNLIGALALNLVDHMQQAGAAVLGHAGETAAALVTIGTEPGLSINQLRSILGLSQPGTVRLVDRLAQEGWVERQAGADGRTLALVLTPHGQEKQRAVLAARQAALERSLNCLTPPEQAHLTPLLEKMLVALTTSEREAFAICRLCDVNACPSDRCPVEQTYCQFISP